MLACLNTTQVGQRANHSDHAMAAHAQKSHIVEEYYAGDALDVAWLTQESAYNYL